ncbi:MAG: autotransporter-associated beta strand repeat-containing protein, partial [Thermoguttaceae bacterium]
NLTLAGNVDLGGANQTINVVNTGSTTLSGVLSHGGLVKSGPGTLTLAGSNAYSGGTTLGAGTLNLSHQYALQNSTLTMTGGGNLAFDSSVSSNAFNLGGLSAASSGPGYDIALLNNAALPATPAPITLTVGGNNASTTYAGVLSDSYQGGSLVKAGTGALYLTGNHTYTGGTSIAAGKLILGPTAGLGDTVITVGSGAIFAPQPANGGTITAGNSAASLTVNAGGVFDMSGDSAAGTFQVNGSTATNFYSLTLSGGTLGFDLVGSSADQLVIPGSTYANVSGINTISITGVGALTLGVPYPLISIGQSGLTSGGGTWQLASGTINSGGKTYGLTLNSEDWEESVTVSAVNTNNSVLALSPSALTLNVHRGDTTTTATASVTNSGTSDGHFTPGSTGDGVNLGASANTFVSAGGNTPMTAAWADTTNVGPRSATITITNNDNNSDVTSGQSQNITGSVYSGQGVWAASNSGNWSDFSKWQALGGVPGKDGPTLSAADTATFGQAGSQTVTLDISPQVSALNLSNGPYTLNTLTGANALHLSSTASGQAAVASSGTQNIAAPVSLDNLTDVTVSSGSLSISGAISGPGGLVKNGTGLLTLNATPNSYQGGTTISGGTLQFGSSSSLGSTGLTINAGTAKTQGDFNLNATHPVNLNSASATIDPANSGDVLTLSGVVSGSGGLTKMGSGTLVLSNTNNHASGFTGGTTLSGGTLEYTSSAAVDKGSVEFAGGNLVLSFGAGGGSVVSSADTASGLSASSPSAGLDSAVVAPPAGAGSALTVAGVPEPGTLGLLAAGLLAGLIAWLRRRRA